MFRIDRRRAHLTAGLVALTACLAPAAAKEPRIVVHLDEPFEIAGRSFPSGEVSVREIDAYSPMATLNEIQCNGESIGLFLARESSGAPAATADELTFARGVSGRLVLVAVARRGQPERSLLAIGDLPVRSPAPGGALVAAR